MVEHLNRLFIDFEAWLAELARGQEQERTATDRELAAKLDELDKVNKREERLRGKYFDALDADDATEGAAFELYEHVLREREALQEAVRALQEASAAEPEQPPVDSMLDVYNALARAVRTGAGEGMGGLNDRLRSVFAEFRLDEVEAGVVGVLPILRPDVIERYGRAAGDDRTRGDEAAPGQPAANRAPRPVGDGPPS